MFRIGSLAQDTLDLENLAAQPVRIDAPEGDYSHETQTRVRKAGHDTVMWTPNATQTFNFQGRPNDADSD